MTLDEIEAYSGSLKKCPKCSSSEGFWFTSNRKRSYVQCKNCGAILEICETFPEAEKKKTMRIVFRK